ncbi:MAG: hypothetical protein GWM92_22165 [Gemmatimonadetes bacterium]|nr:RDD family protein [Gemmatimonadota bacterium]NIR81573.1 RDD family protein [Gemmatimonadota bacterium]NIT90414.1 RDD family protein [Gemmatimonadota bacterium]NIU34248.1 RDD family protein [Gemmatimonadota bacterium]NIU38376.1 hypothetical protein [Gemmatimonadota bacterium]
MSTASERGRDPRSIVTAEAFELAPRLLGTPLARPARRLGAILVDLILIAIVSQAGGILLGIVATLFFIYLARGRKPADALARVFRLVVGCFGALLLLMTSRALFFAFGPDWEQIARSLPEEIAVEAPSAPGREIGLADILDGTREYRRLQVATTEPGAEEAAARLARRLQRLGAPISEIPEALREMAPDDAAWSDRIDRIVATAMASLDSARGAATDTGLVPGAGVDAAVQPADAAEDSADPGEGVADTVSALLAALNGERRDRERAERRLEEARQELVRSEGGWLPGAVRELWDDLGLAFGWGTIYMTIFLSWWNGQTPGKRLLGIRVVQLDNSPITWWEAFERAGGYAAGFATGLLGFAQVYWDPNRQAIHDKISETVVVLEGRDPVPGPWSRESGPGTGDASRRGGRGSGPALPLEDPDATPSGDVTPGQ